MPLPPANYDALLKELAEFLVTMVHCYMEEMGNAEAVGKPDEKYMFGTFVFEDNTHKKLQNIKMNVYFRWTMPMFHSNLLRVLILFQNAGY